MSESGAAAVEFALVAIPLFFILYALIAFGMMLALKQSVTSATAEGARAVVGVVDDPATTGVDERVLKAQTTVANRLSWLGAKYQPGDLTVSWYNSSSGACDTPAGGTPPSPPTICVKIAYPYNTRPLIPTAPGLGLITPSTLGSEARVQVGS
ncbi:MAG: pilus assembly protein [Actinomycetota bacterium]|nr:pilus assembly protein [Actinomycetota bacterium]